MQHIKLEFENLSEQYSFNYVAQAANGGILYQNGGSVLLASVCTQENEKYDDELNLASLRFSLQGLLTALCAHFFLKVILT